MDPESKAYRYHVKEAIPFDTAGRLVLFDAVPHALRHRLRTPVRSSLLAGSLYLAFLTGTGAVQAQSQVVYSLLTVSALFGLGIFNKQMKHSFKVSRVFLLKSGKEIRVENCSGLFTDVPIDRVTLLVADRLTSTLTITLDDQQSVTLALREATYFDPELLYAISSQSVATVTPTTTLLTFVSEPEPR